MNTQLQKLFDNSKLSQKDRYEINQIFELLPLYKQKNLLENFDILVFRLEEMHKEIELERSILIWDIFSDIRNLYSKYS